MDVFTSLVNAHKDAPPRVRVIDIFMGFLVLSGIVQFSFCLLVGNFVSTLSGHRLYRRTVINIALQRFLGGIQRYGGPVCFVGRTEDPSEPGKSKRVPKSLTRTRIL